VGALVKETGMREVLVGMTVIVVVIMTVAVVVAVVMVMSMVVVVVVHEKPPRGCRSSALKES
jgi:uncharacterized membrane protein